MGVASYYEDIRDRLADDLAALNRTVSRRSIGHTKQRTISSIERVLNSAIANLEALIDLATDPAIDSASRVLELEREAECLKADLNLQRVHENRLLNDEKRDKQQIHDLLIKMSGLTSDNKRLRNRDAQHDDFVKKLNGQILSIKAERDIALSKTKKLEEKIEFLEREKYDLADFKADPGKYYNQYPPGTSRR